MQTKSSVFFLKLLIVILLNLVLIGLAGHMLPAQNDNQAIQTLSKRGSTGEEVRQIQTKLQALGLYTIKIDGIYGAQTEAAVRTFQQNNGLKVDGIAGPETLRALGIGQDSAGVSDSDFQLLARIISAEARGEPYIGQVAVGAVVLNRVEHPSFPDTIAGVIYEKGAFTAVTDGQFQQPVAESAYAAAREALNGSDPSGGAIFYFNPDKTNDQWIRTRPVIKRIGDHLFCA